LPHDRLATEIAQRARLRGAGSTESFAVVFAGIGVPHDTAEQFRLAMEASGALGHTAMFLNLADEPGMQRLLTPRYALTAAEYLAFEEGRHVLVILTDMTNYCEALREVSASHGEIPGRKGYPGYMYSDLASLYERAGCIRGRPGTLTQLPILTMPGDDIGHPIPDLTGYITEGQIVLSRDLHRRGVWPPVDVLPSLSRLMNAGIGTARTVPEHREWANQLYALYARGRDARTTSAIVGEASLGAMDRLAIAFADRFESRFVGQGDQRRTIQATIDIGWSLIESFPRDELTRLSEATWSARRASAPSPEPVLATGVL
jgi:V/A-type H+-transporting ATPase subunit B